MQNFIFKEKEGIVAEEACDLCGRDLSDNDFVNMGGKKVCGICLDHKD